MQRSRETVVVDSSVAVKWYLRDEDMISQADRLFGEMRDGYVTAIAPYLARYEVSRAITVACRMGRHTWQQGQAAVRSFLDSGICLAADSDWLLLAATNLALQTGVALYDAIYVSLADQLAVTYITADRRLYNAITSHYRFVRWLGDL